MEIKQYISLEVKKGDHTFSFTLPAGSTWGSALDASFEMLQQINKFITEAAEKAKPVQEAQDVEVVEPKQ